METRDIPGYPDYRVTEAGAIFSCKSGEWRPVKLFTKGKGGEYFKVKLYRDGEITQATVHSIVALTFIGPRPPGMVLNHVDANKQHNHYSNLEYVTYSENNCHAYRTGLKRQIKRERIPKPPRTAKPRARFMGEANPSAKLTAAKVIMIRAMHAQGFDSVTIARTFGVSRTCVCKIKRNLMWKEQSTACV